MSDTTKLVIVVLAAIVVLFVLGLGVGGSGTNNGQGGLPGISVNGVKNTLIGLFPSPALPLDELSASSSGCLDRAQRRIVVPSAGGCLFTIAPSDATVRSLKLEIAPGVSVNITMTTEPVEGESMDIDTDLPSHESNQTTLTFFASKLPKTLTISQCSNSGGCALTILE